MDSELAFDLEARVRAARAYERRSWVVLAEALHEFYQAKAWRSLGYASFREWLGVPEISISRSRGEHLLRAWRFAQEHRIPSDELARVDLPQLVIVMPSVRNGGASVEDALTDAEACSRSDLLKTYRPTAEKAAQPPVDPFPVCPRCGYEPELKEAA